MKTKNQELSQAFTRVSISLISLIIAISMIVVLHEEKYLMAFYCVLFHLVFSLIIFVLVKENPQEVFARRVFGIILDLSMLSLVVYVLGTKGIFVYPIYLWVIVGNGMRYGLKYLFISLTVAIALFFVAIYFSPLWKGEFLLALSLAVGFIFLSMFYIKLIKKLHILNEKLSLELEKTKHASLHDPLTGLPNRSFFSLCLKKTLSRCTRSGDSFSVAYMDLDNFKPVNDTFGHDYGDKLLQDVAERMKSVLRDSDFVARLGGDEFGIIIIGANNLEETMVCIDRLQKVINEPYNIFGKTINISGSFGVAIYPLSGDCEMTLLKEADKNMYLNKANKI